MTTQTKTTMIPTAQLNLLKWVNLFYGTLGLSLFAQLTVGGAWKSFALGWAVAVGNLELLKRLSALFLGLYRGETLSPAFYVLLFGKFAFWGLVIALFSLVPWIQGIPFVVGTSTLLVAGLGLGVKELVYARTS